MDTCTHNFKNILTSSLHANFRLDVFHSKSLYIFWGKKKRIKI